MVNMKTKKSEIKNIVLAALFLSIGFLLPMLTNQVKEIGDSLLPMHLPVLLCGLICGWKYGAMVGLLLPFLRGAVFSMPPLYPNAVWMAAELATYGLTIGLIYSKVNRKNLFSVYFSLIPAMLCGRVVWGITKAVLLGVGDKAFTFSMFIAGGFIDALPGIALQLILIPAIMQILNKQK